MNSETPKFDASLDEIFQKLIPFKKDCLWKNTHDHCEGEFSITKEDIEFLKMLRVPPPSYCPTCRRIRRVAFMGSNRFFKRVCDAKDHGESMISILPADCPFPVYDYMYFISDEFDPFSFGSDYKEDLTPMSNLLSLRKKFPMPSFLNRDSLSLNSDYSNGGRNLKNGYYAFGCFDSENVWYANLILKSKDIMDSRAIRHSEFVYKSLSSDYLYKSSFIYFSNHIVESMFLFDCRNCDYCFGCVNLRNKKYCIFNEQVSREDYESFMKSNIPFSRGNLKSYEEKFWQFVKSLPMNGSHNVGSENVFGVGIENSKNLYDCVDADNSENCRYADGAMSHKDSMDILFSGGHSHNLYGTINVGSHASNVKFSVSSKFSRDSEFIFNCKNVSNCFMCFGLQNKSYCVLNKQYEKEEYFKIVDNIKTQMLQKGEYADGLSLEFSAQPYNFSSGYSTYPMNDDQIMKIGSYVSNEGDTNAGDIVTIKPEDVPQTIVEVSEDILNQAIICEKTNRPFRIIPTELEFYRKMNLPLPVMHPTPRMRIFADFKPTSKKYEAFCGKCGKQTSVMFDPSYGFNLYCEKCYQAEVS